MQAVVNEDAAGTREVLQAEVQRLKRQLAALQGQGLPGLAPDLASSLGLRNPPNGAAAETAQVLPCFAPAYKFCIFSAKGICLQAQVAELVNMGKGCCSEYLPNDAHCWSGFPIGGGNHA